MLYNLKEKYFDVKKQIHLISKFPKFDTNKIKFLSKKYKVLSKV